MREKLIELIKKAKRNWSLSTMVPVGCSFESFIADQLIANGVTVPVYCKECKYRYKTVSGLKICQHHITMEAKDGNFCSYGERREGE